MRPEPQTEAAAEGLVCGDFDIRIDRDGTWFYHGSPIGRKELVRLFASVLQRHEDGSYWLATPAERGRIAVDDVPFVAVEATLAGSGRDMTVSLRTNLDDSINIDVDHPLRMVADPQRGDPVPYVTVRDGLEARLTRSVYYELVALGVEEKVSGEPHLGIWSNGTFFPLGRLDDSTAAP